MSPFATKVIFVALRRREVWGDFLLQCEVAAILTKNGRVVGVKTSMGECFACSAVVVATMKAAALCKVKQNITAVVGLVENMPSGHASRPGDVVTSMSGQTVEIIDTDAEGRLGLGDCLWYLQKNFAVKNIIDVATLTGSTMRTFGFEYAGLFSNNDKLAEKLYSKGLESGEKLWRLPVTKEYDKMIDSDIADMKNLGPMNGGGITAACFLQRFVEKGTHWAHIDIAGMDMSEGNDPLYPKGASGFGVQLLNTLILQKLL